MCLIDCLHYPRELIGLIQCHIRTAFFLYNGWTAKLLLWCAFFVHTRMKPCVKSAFGIFCPCGAEYIIPNLSLDRNRHRSKSHYFRNSHLRLGYPRQPCAVRSWRDMEPMPCSSATTRLSPNPRQAKPSPCRGVPRHRRCLSILKESA